MVHGGEGVVVKVILLYDVADVHLRHVLTVWIWDLLLLLLLHRSGRRLRLLLFLLRGPTIEDHTGSGEPPAMAVRRLL